MIVTKIAVVLYILCGLKSCIADNPKPEWTCKNDGKGWIVTFNEQTGHYLDSKQVDVDPDLPKAPRDCRNSEFKRKHTANDLAGAIAASKGRGDAVNKNYVFVGSTSYYSSEWNVCTSKKSTTRYTCVLKIPEIPKNIIG
jgi:hypothetical protein